MIRKRVVLMNPGPVVVDERVRAALAWPDMCHREPEFAELMDDVRRRLTLACGGDGTRATVVLTGSGTAALEAVVCSTVPQDGRLLVLDNGHYGERLANIAEAYGIAHDKLSFGWAVPFDLETVNSALQRTPAITHVAMVHHETSTGMLNPLGPVGELIARHGRSLIVDAISSLGGEHLHVGNDHVDWCVSSANKCIEGIPGLSFVCAPREKFDALSRVRPRSLYLNLHLHYLAQERDHAPAFTPAVQSMFALKVALDLLFAEGIEGRVARYKMLAESLRAGLAQRGFRMLLPPDHRSNVLTAVYLPPGRTYGDLHDRLKERGFVIYAGQESLRHRVFRLSTMGQISPADIATFLQALDSMGFGPVQGANL